jgi:hypothetical protein
VLLLVLVLVLVLLLVPLLVSKARCWRTACR